MKSNIVTLVIFLSLSCFLMVLQAEKTHAQERCHGQDTVDTCRSILCCVLAFRRDLLLLREEVHELQDVSLDAYSAEGHMRKEIVYLDSTLQSLRAERVPTGAIVHMPSTSSLNAKYYVKADGKTVGDDDSGADYTGSAYMALFMALGYSPEEWKLHKRVPLPDLRGRFLFGSNEKCPVGTVGGEETSKLTQDQMPLHEQYTWREFTREWPFASGEGDGGHHREKLLTSNFTRRAAGGKPHNNMPPYYSMTAFVRV